MFQLIELKGKLTHIDLSPRQMQGGKKTPGTAFRKDFTNKNQKNPAPSTQPPHSPLHRLINRGRYCN